MPDLRPSLATSLKKLANRTLRRGPLEVLGLGIARTREAISSRGDLVMFSVDPSAAQPRQVEGARCRPATSDDATAYARDIGTDTADTFRARLSDATGCYVVEMDDRLVHASWVTTAGAWTRELRAYLDPPTGHAYIYESFTAPSARGRGIYPFALAEICRDAVRRGLARVWVAVEEDNPASLKAVTKAGFAAAFTIEVARRWGRLDVQLPKELPDPAPRIDIQRA